MPDILIPVGRHLFQPADLEKALSVITPQDTGPHGIGARAAIDTDGVKVALVYSVKDGAIVARTAFAYEWGQGYTVGADLSIKL